MANDKQKSDTQKTDSLKGSPLSPFGYTNYRHYLRDFYEQQKASTRGYSYRSFSKAAGFSSPNYLKLVIDGERNVSPEAVQKISQVLKLKGTMASYFEVLVKMNQASSDEERLGHFDTLKKLTPAAKRRSLEATGLEYLSSWLHAVLREMTILPDFRDDPYWIARRMYGKATAEEILRSLQFLVSEGYIEKTSSGRYQPKDNVVLSSDEIRSLAIRNYHRQMLELARESLDGQPLDEREFGALTIILAKEHLGELKSRMKAFRQELHTWALAKNLEIPGDQVVQVNSHMYCHTKKVSA